MPTVWITLARSANDRRAAALATEGDRAVRWDAVSVAALLYLAIMGSAVTFTLYYRPLSRFTAKRMSLVAYVIPVIAVGIELAKAEPNTWRG